jgi:hypothetical protein
MPVTKPLFVTVAIALLLLVHVPPVLGVNVVVLPIQIFLEPDTVTTGLAMTAIDPLASDGQAVLVCVNVNVALPAAAPVTTPAFDTVATDALLLAHVPPVVGLNVLVLPIHIDVAPVMLIVGLAFTVKGAVAAELQPVLVNVYVNVTVPALIAVINPAFVIVATDVLLLVHVPPVLGLIVVVPPMHKLVFAPVIFVVGFGLIVAVTAVLVAVVHVPLVAST